MLKKSLLILFVFIFSASSFAQMETMETITEQQEDINKIIGEQMSKAMSKTGEALTEAVPQMIGSMSDMMAEMLKAMGPIIAAIEENKALPKANEEMAAKLKAAIDSKYNQNVTTEINDKMNEIVLTGEYKEGDSVLKYRIRRNLAEAVLISDLIQGKRIAFKMGMTPDNENMMVDDLYDNSIDVNKLKTNKIYDNTYIGLVDSSQENIVLYSNIGAYITLTIQAKGPEYKELANNFMYSLNNKAIREAINDDNRDIEEIKKDINNKLKDPLYMQKILQQQGSNTQHE